MPRLSKGQMMPNFPFQTPFKGNLSFYDALNDKKTVLLFHRFIGCRLSQFDIRSLAQGYDQIIATGGQVLVVVQSTPETVREYYGENSLPFSIICDPEQMLYNEFEIRPANSVEELQGGRFKEKLEEITYTDLVRGKDEGEPLQLPAIFVIDETLKITYAYYGKNAADIPNVSEITQLVKLS